MSRASEDEADDQLVLQCLAGDTRAFGWIVQRYQSLVCSLALSACGDVHRSEDIAQESFLIAWRQLSDLREPSKLKAWLCAIVRNVANNALRKDRRTPAAQAEELDEAIGAPCGRSSPTENVISREEEAILLRQLQEMPPLYREPMVLFYRQHESVVAVADALGISEDTARQRLARGRVMLAERVERSLGKVLRTSSPTTAFTLGVVGALAKSTAQTAAATAAGATAAGATAAGATAKAAKGAAAVGLFGAFWLPILAAIVGLWNYFKGQAENIQPGRERRFVMIWMAILWLTAVVIGVAMGAGLKIFEIRHKGSYSVFIWSAVIVVAILCYIVSFGTWANLRRRKIRIEEGGDVEVGRFFKSELDPDRPGFQRAVLGVIFAIGAAFNAPLIATMDAEVGWGWMLLAFLLPVCISGLTAWIFTRRSGAFRQIILMQWCALLSQLVGLSGICWWSWYQAGLFDEHLGAAAGQVSVCLLWAGIIMLSWFHYHRQNWGRGISAGQEQRGGQP